MTDFFNVSTDYLLGRTDNPNVMKGRDNVTIVKVDSSAILKIGYDDSRLFVEFVGGKWYKYVPVPETVFEQFIKAPSKGYFVNKFIKPIYHEEALTSQELETVRRAHLR